MTTATADPATPAAAVTPLDEVVEHFAHLAANAGESLTHLKLQALCYYAQAFYLGTYGKPLFEGRFEAWPDGAFVPALFERYSQYQLESIPPASPAPPQLPLLRQEALLEEVFGRYGALTDVELGGLVLTWGPVTEHDRLQHEEISAEVLADHGRRLNHLIMTEARAATPAGYDPACEEAESAERIARSLEDLKAGRHRRW